MALKAQRKTLDPPAVLDPELGNAMFDQEARRIVGFSGDEFIARWDAGEFRDFEDTPEGRELVHLILLIPFGRRLT